MVYDFNGAETQRENSLIPDGTIAVVHLTIRPGNAGEGGWLKRSKAGDSQSLDCEFTVVEGQYAKRKFWSLFTVEGTTDGHAKAAEISASRLRGVLESARGIRPDDESEAAKNSRRVQSWGDFDGLRFIAKIGIEKGTNGYKDKNTLASVITPDKKDWVKVEQVAKTVQTLAQAAAPAIAAAQTNGAAAAKPAWAQ